MPLSPGQVLNNRYRIASLLCLLTILSVFPAACDGSTQNPAQVTVSEVEMALIPAGEFQMGSEYGESDEQPVHTVYLDAYSIDVYEVIYQQYAQFLQSQGNQQEGGVAWLEADSSSVHVHQVGGKWQADAGFEMHPVVEVSWYGARAYCQWRGGDLPTEAQWEKAGRGGLQGKAYPWGNEKPLCRKGARNGAKFDDNAACNDTGAEPVGSYGPNGYGLYDMAGNVWEWVLDWYQDTFYASSPAQNPAGPPSGQYRVVRGGSWGNVAGGVLIADRSWTSPTLRDSSQGFRCVRTP